MGNLTVLVLRVVIAVAFAGSVLVQFGLAPLLWNDLDGAPTGVRVAVVAIVVLGVASMQVIGVCVWRLLTMVRTGTVFSPAAFRYVDVVIGAIAAGSVLTLGLAVVAAYSNRTTPGDVVAPGVVGLICGAALVGAGVALLVLVLRVLLVQAVALDVETKHLREELEEVI
jgi:hypothetical protein